MKGIIMAAIDYELSENATDLLLDDYIDYEIVDCKPPIDDGEDRPRRGKKGKYIKDWQ